MHRPVSIYLSDCNVFVLFTIGVYEKYSFTDLLKYTTYMYATFQIKSQPTKCRSWRRTAKMVLVNLSTAYIMWGSLSRSYTGSYDFWIVRLVALWPRCDRSAMSVTISSSGCILRLIFSVWAHAWSCDHQRVEKIMARSLVDNRATSGSDHRPIVGQSLRPTTDRTINRGVVWLIVRSIVGSGDRSRDQSLHPATDRTSNRGICNRSYDWRYHQSQSRATNQDRSRVVALPNVMSFDGWHHQSCYCLMRDHHDGVDNW